MKVIQMANDIPTRHAAADVVLSGKPSAWVGMNIRMFIINDVTREAEHYEEKQRFGMLSPELKGKVRAAVQRVSKGLTWKDRALNNPYAGIVMGIISGGLWTAAVYCSTPKKELLLSIVTGILIAGFWSIGGYIYRGTHIAMRINGELVGRKLKGYDVGVG